MSYTPSIIYNKIRELGFDVDASLLNESGLYGLMSDAELLISLIVGPTEATTTDSSVIDQREYDRPSGALKILRVEWNKVKLKKIPMGDVDVIEGQSYGGITSFGNCVYYYEFAEKIGLSPIPREVAEIKYWYQAQPTALSSSSTSFVIPNYYSIFIVPYCLSRMMLKDDQKGARDRYEQEWNDGLFFIESDWSKRNQKDRIEQVQLEEIYPDSELGII